MSGVRYPTWDHAVIHRFQTSTRSCDWFKKFLNLWCAPYERLVPEVISGILHFILFFFQFIEHPIRRQKSTYNIVNQFNKIREVTLMSSMKVISRPHGWGRLTIRRSNNTLVICSWTISCTMQQIHIYVSDLNRQPIILCARITHLKSSTATNRSNFLKVFKAKFEHMYSFYHLK